MPLETQREQTFCGLAVSYTPVQNSLPMGQLQRMFMQFLLFSSGWKS